ncbi:hypothetical protein GCM10028791_34410 [Echinicola sediminis]
MRESLEQEYSSPLELQKQQLKKQLITAGRTQIERNMGSKTTYSISGNLRTIFIRLLPDTAMFAF